MKKNVAYQAVIAAPPGRIGIRMAGETVEALDYLPADAPEQPPVDEATRTVVEQLAAYFRDPRHRFTVPLAPQLGSAARAVGGACRNNPIPILVPCHRVVGQQGLGGYAGAMNGDPLGIKRWLLRHEGVEVAG